MTSRSRAFAPTPDVWTGAAGTSFWSNPGNWSLGAIPAAGEDVVFNTAGNSVNIDSSPVDIGSLTLDSTHLFENPISVEGAIASTGTSTVGNPITLIHNTAINAGTGSIDFYGTIAGAFGITVAGGTVTLGVTYNHPMTYTGTTEVESGATLKFDVAIASPIVLDAGSSLTVAGPGAPSITSNGGTIHIVSPHNNDAEQLAVSGFRWTLDSASTLAIPIDSTTIGQGSASAGYGQIVVSTGTVTLAGTLATVFQPGLRPGDRQPIHDHRQQHRKRRHRHVRQPTGGRRIRIELVVVSHRLSRRIERTRRGA